MGLLRWKEGWKRGVWVECGAEQKANGGHTERQAENQDRREGCVGRTGGRGLVYSWQSWVWGLVGLWGHQGKDSKLVVGTEA